MKNIQQWMEDYGASHQNSTNKLIHWICVPFIFFSITGFFYSIDIPIEVREGVRLNMAIVLLIGLTVYYFFLSRTLWIGMFLFSILCVLGCYFIERSGLTLWVVCLTIFALAWIGQFYGHSVEGKKPSFVKDIQFLLIGPAWLMSFIYNRIGISL